MKDMKVMKGSKHSVLHTRRAMVQRQVAFGSLPIPHDTRAPRKDTLLHALHALHGKNIPDRPNPLARANEGETTEVKALDSLAPEAALPLEKTLSDDRHITADR
ncbi:hypothetical protein THIOKS1890029 [Thiocapsa sp. KS1]|nr:hypothetical protein [Thiocapsa sp. KS1]CRI67896.1 hypothetical protein THIOKS1890029 [Thiocapsa sp. KS1]